MRPFSTPHARLERALATALVAVAACVAAVWVAPRASGAAADWMRTPSVRLRTLTMPGDGELAVAGPSARAAAVANLDAGMRFSMAGVLCDIPAGDSPAVRVRTSLDGSVWSPWMEAPLEVAGEGAAVRAFTEPLWTGPSRYLQIAAVAGGRGGPAALTGVRLVAIDPAEDAGVVARVVGTVRRTVAAIAGVSLVPPVSAATMAPVVVTRAEWGADEQLRSGSPSYATVKMAFVHHTAGGNTYAPADAPALVRGIYAYHTRSLGWRDIGYNFLVDRFGTIYEGRYGGMTKGVSGAHVLGFNSGSTGISVMGTFSDEAPPAEVVAALECLLAWKLSVHGLDPAATASLTCGATEKYEQGAVVTFPVIAGHRQANHTECPGAALYGQLPTVRTGVAGRMRPSVTAGLSAGAPVISPNGDGILDEVQLSVTVSTAADWRLTLRDPAGSVIASWSGQGTSAALTWAGLSGAARVPDGVYTAELTATAAAGDAVPATQTITVDRTLGFAAAAPATISPNGDGVRDASTLGFRLTRRAAVTVTLSLGSAVVRTLRLGTLAAGARTVRWDGKAGSGAYLTSGRPVLTVTAVSAIGESSVTKGLVVDLYRPRPYAPKTLTARCGAAARLGFKISDPFSARVNARYTVTDTKGRLVASGHPGWLPSGKTLTTLWRPRSRGIFTVAWHATDLGGNHESAPAATRLVVR